MKFLLFSPLVLAWSCSKCLCRAYVLYFPEIHSVLQYDANYNKLSVVPCAAKWETEEDPDCQKSSWYLKPKTVPLVQGNAFEIHFRQFAPSPSFAPFDPSSSSSSSSSSCQKLLQVAHDNKTFHRGRVSLFVRESPKNPSLWVDAHTRRYRLGVRKMPNQEYKLCMMDTSEDYFMENVYFHIKQRNTLPRNQVTKQ